MNDLPTAGPFGPLRPDPCRMASCGDRSSSASIPIRLARAPNLAEELYEGSVLDHEEAKHLLSDYVMGELSSDDAAELQAHASDCQDCREIVISMGIVKEELETYGPVLFESPISHQCKLGRIVAAVVVCQNRRTSGQALPWCRTLLTDDKRNQSRCNQAL